ncbi:UNVERIFIED_CONTAM: hypothetical protein GTU68_034471 [Idotea baltica]|nr:hypothetical protein [Idotea baltica]
MNLYFKPVRTVISWFSRYRHYLLLFLLQSLSAELKGQPGSLRALKCDITKDDEVYALFKTIKQELGGVDICINNAGMSFNNSLLDGNPEEWRYMMSLNVVAICLCTKLAVASMRERKVDDGHIINISSYAGHRVGDDSKLHFYASTKFALRAISEGLRQELRELKSHIRVSVG